MSAELQPVLHRDSVTNLLTKFEDYLVCAYCGGIPPISLTKPRRYCSDKCKVGHWRELHSIVDGGCLRVVTLDEPVPQPLDVSLLSTIELRDKLRELDTSGTRPRLRTSATITPGSKTRDDVVEKITKPRHLWKRKR